MFFLFYFLLVSSHVYRFQVSTTYNAAGVTDLELTTSLADGSTEPQFDSIQIPIQIPCVLKQRRLEQECKELTKLKVNQDLKMEDRIFCLCCNQ